MTDERQRYRHFFRCRQCATRFHVDRLTADPARVKAPRCPRRTCGGKSKESYQADVGFDPASGKAPATVGAIPVRAMDMATEIAMQDHQLSNLRDDARPGESTAPKLVPHLQKQADGFWGNQKRQTGTRTANVDMSPIFGERATKGMPQGARFTADQGSAIAPILQSGTEGQSPVPKHTVVAG